MEELLEISENLIDKVPLDFQRYLYQEINWKNRLIGLKGARGTGKTTLLLQWLNRLPFAYREKAYLSLDELYFTAHSLTDTAKAFYQQGGKIIVLDEVHKYPTWSQEIKNLHDRYSDLTIVFTGSSIIDLARQETDLSRRALMYELKGMSYREYLNYVYGLSLPSLGLEDLLEPKTSLRSLFPKDFRPLVRFKEYLAYGYYPFAQEDQTGFYARLRQMARTIVEYDMAELKGFDIRHAKKMLQLLYVVAQQVPFKPNINSLAAKTGIHRNSINNYLYFLQKARLISLLSSKGYSMSTLQKPEKIYFENTNLLYALSEQEPSLGTIREVFFHNQLQVRHRLSSITQADFEVDGKYQFEIGGKHKGKRQIQGLEHAFIVKDELEFPVGNNLPLWAFGFLY
jgi:predicted AAA+ superfamily ATPase